MNEKSQGTIGIPLLIAIAGITFLLELAAKAANPQIPTPFFLGVSQIFGVVGATLLSVNFILATRFSFLEPLFGGADKLYKAHHTVGLIAFLMLVYHPLFLIMSDLASPKLILRYVLPGISLDTTIGILTLWIFAAIMVANLFLKLPYHIWKFVHQAMGFVAIGGIVHALLVVSDISRYYPLRYWILGWLICSLLAYVYKVYLYTKLGPRYKYTIAGITTSDDIINLELQPVDKEMQYKPGQFVYMVVQSTQVGSESHPFSISSASSGSTIRLSIKKVGDYTKRLVYAKVGDPVALYGPYGEFYKAFLHERPVVCVAGGIGITPFLSMLADEAKQHKTRSVKLYYCVRTPEEAGYQRELETDMLQAARISVTNVYTSKEGRLTAQRIFNENEITTDTQFLLCGPQKMMKDIEEQLKQHGITEDRISYEDFSFL